MSFVSRYEHCYDEMMKMGMEIKLETPFWLDKNDIDFTKEGAFGKKVTHIITHPEYWIVANEVGMNTNQKGDSYKGGQKFLVERRTTAKNQWLTKDCHFTIIKVTELTSEPVMCILILIGTHENACVEVGVD